MQPSGLNVIYSLRFYPKCWEQSDSETDDGSSLWLVGAGKSGLVTVFRERRNTSMIESLVLRGGWMI